MLQYFVTNAEVSGEPYVAAEFVEGWVADGFRHEVGGALMTRDQLETHFPEALTAWQRRYDATAETDKEFSDLDFALEQARQEWVRSLTDEEFHSWLDREWPGLQACSEPRL